MNKDELKGKVKQAKGYVKEELGEMIGNEELEAEGRAERVEGHVQEGVGKAKRVADEAVDEAKRRTGS